MTKAATTHARWTQPREYPEQLIMMATTEMAVAIRDWAADHGMPVSRALRELVLRGMVAMIAPPPSPPETQDKGS